MKARKKNIKYSINTMFFTESLMDINIKTNNINIINLIRKQEMVFI